MLSLTTLYALTLASLVNHSVGQVASGTATAANSVQTHVIAVGNGDHKFRPDVTQANVGDIIEFQFFPPNHSVVRAEYQSPCIPYEMTGRGKVGFFAGFHPVDAILSNPPKWSIRVNDTNPIFFYCSAPGSCINWGMVGVINPNASTSLQVQKQMAQDSAYMLQPGESFPAEASSSATGTSTKASTLSTSITASSTQTTSASSTTATAAGATTTVAAASTSHGIGTGPIVGIAIGCVAILGLAAALCFYVGRSKTLKQQVDRNSAVLPLSPHSSHAPPAMYQSQPYIAPMQSSKMTDASSRNSVAAAPGVISPHYERYSTGMSSDAKADYVINVEESMFNRSGSPRGGALQSQSPNPNAPMRHPSVLLNPNDPQEMQSNDNRYRDYNQY